VRSVKPRTLITNRLRVPSSAKLALLRRPAASFSLEGTEVVEKSGPCRTASSEGIWCFSLGRVIEAEGNAGGSERERERAFGSLPKGIAGMKGESAGLQPGSQEHTDGAVGSLRFCPIVRSKFIQRCDDKIDWNSNEIFWRKWANVE
jgi:hypothetical protein